MDRYYDWLLTFLRQFLLIPNRNNKFMDLTANYSTPALISSAGIWSIPGDLLLFSFSIANSTSVALGSGTSGSAVCIAVCLTSLTPWEKYFLYLAKILWYSATKSPFLSFTIIVLGWYVPILEVINVPIYVRDIVDLAVSFKFLNLSFQTCLLPTKYKLYR
jgi:hypothetical protein